MSGINPIGSAAGDPAADARGLSLALLGHDLRAALAELRVGLHLLNQLTLPTELLVPLDRCRAVGDTLDRLIDQSILVCLGQGSAIANAPSVVNVVEFLETLRQRWTGHCADSGHSFALVAAGTLPATITIDRTALERVLANLIGNVLRHTPSGPVTVTVKISDGAFLLLAVEDQGPGFADAQLTALQQGDVIAPGPQSKGGGFGLQSVKLLVNAMGGRCTLRNKPGGGAEMRICLPLAPPTATLTASATPASAAAVAAAPPLAAPAPDLTGTRLLLVEDSATCRELAVWLAQQIGAVLTMVEDGTQAITALQAGPLPDVLILDDEMPGASGQAVLRWLRAQGGAHVALPVLALTSHIGVDEVAALIAAGANAVLAKPVLCPQELGRAIARAQSGAGTPAPAAARRAIADLSALKRLCQLAGPEAAAELFEKLTEDLTTARNGLAQATRTADLPTLRAHSHVIIALAGTAGDMTLHDEAVTLNSMAHDPSHPLERVIALGKALDSGLAALLEAVAYAAPPALPATFAPEIPPLVPGGLPCT